MAACASGLQSSLHLHLGAVSASLINRFAKLLMYLLLLLSGRPSVAATTAETCGAIVMLSSLKEAEIALMPTPSHPADGGLHPCPGRWGKQEGPKLLVPGRVGAHEQLEQDGPYGPHVVGLILHSLYAPVLTACRSEATMVCRGPIRGRSCGLLLAYRPSLPQCQGGLGHSFPLQLHIN